MEPPGGGTEAANEAGSLYHTDLDALVSVSRCLIYRGMRCRRQPTWPTAPLFAALPPVQDLLPACYTGEDTAAWLRDSMLTLRLQGTAAADVAVSGAGRAGQTLQLHNLSSVL